MPINASGYRIGNDRGRKPHEMLATADIREKALTTVAGDSRIYAAFDQMRRLVEADARLYRIDKDRIEQEQPEGPSADCLSSGEIRLRVSQGITRHSGRYGPVGQQPQILGPAHHEKPNREKAD
jgi:hypothetical protein